MKKTDICDFVRNPTFQSPSFHEMNTNIQLW